MYWLPYQQFDLDLPLSRSEVAKSWEEQVERPRLFRGFKNQPKLEGRLKDDDTFVVWRANPLQRWFLPVFYGRIQETTDGTQVRVQAVPPRVLFFILLFACGAFSLMAVSTEHRQVVMAAANMLLVGWLLGCGGFWIDGGNGRKFLAQVFGAEPPAT